MYCPPPGIRLCFCCHTGRFKRYRQTKSKHKIFIQKLRLFSDAHKWNARKNMAVWKRNLGFLHLYFCFWKPWNQFGNKGFINREYFFVIAEKHQLVLLYVTHTHFLLFAFKPALFAAVFCAAIGLSYPFSHIFYRRFIISGLYVFELCPRLQSIQ